MTEENGFQDFGVNFLQCSLNKRSLTQRKRIRQALKYRDAYKDKSCKSEMSSGVTSLNVIELRQIDGISFWKLVLIQPITS